MPLHDHPHIGLSIDSDVLGRLTEPDAVNLARAVEYEWPSEKMPLPAG